MKAKSIKIPHPFYAIQLLSHFGNRLTVILNSSVLVFIITLLNTETELLPNIIRNDNTNSIAFYWENSTHSITFIFVYMRQLHYYVYWNWKGSGCYWKFNEIIYVNHLLTLLVKIGIESKSFIQMQFTAKNCLNHWKSIRKLLKSYKICNENIAIDPLREYINITTLWCQ